ncbi:M15 family metallopeptidase [Catenovulum sediminis]|uniref:M15 family metallopeptidase n=1 Tax=Catenovulum sediminis TaxID=1740262 RepID=A0ABV1RM52_9ALTE|nr:M15 family metallopeptidase [Catenovulum sediminis]
MYSFTDQQITGLDDALLVELYPNHFVHHASCEAVKGLQNNAIKAGFDIRLASSFRSFARQKSIWNEKCNGRRPVYDRNNTVLDIKVLSPFELADHICFFSAIPGSSRHHWGCDFDVYDLNGFKNNDKPQLIKNEYTLNGPNYPMFQWLQAHAQPLGFAFPYLHVDGKCGVAYEPWHISHVKVSQSAQKLLTPDTLIRCWQNNPFLLSDVILNNFDYFYATYIEPYHV